MSILKGIVSFILIIVSVFSLCFGVFAHEGDMMKDGGHFTTKMITKIIEPAKTQYKVTLVNIENTALTDWETKLLLDGEKIEIGEEKTFYELPDFEAKIKLGSTEKEEIGTLEETTTNIIVETGYGSATYTFNIEVLKNIIPEVTKEFEILSGYHFHIGKFAGWEVTFNPNVEIKIEDYKNFNKITKPYIPKTSKKIDKKTFLYKKSDWNFNENLIIKDDPTTNTEPETSVTPSPSQSNGVNTTQNNNTVYSDKDLPKTGETNPIVYTITGFCLLVLGCFVRYKKYCSNNN